MTVPLPPDTILFRYRPFHQFTEILAMQSLWFASAETLSDVNEGRFLPTFVDPNPHRQIARPTIEYSDRIRCVSCWSINESPCHFMWSQFAPALGIAIQTTISSLLASLHLTLPYLEHGRMLYDPASQTNKFRKDLKYAREKEYRVRYLPLGYPQPGHPVAVNLATLIHGVWIAPHNDTPEFVRSVKDELARHSLGSIPLRIG